MMAISAATVLLGGGIGLAIANSRPKSDHDGSISSPKPGEVTANNLPTEIDVAGKVTDGMSFEQAFITAREEVGVGGAYNWHGRWYNTFEKEEWSGLSLEQRQQYTEMITEEKLPFKVYSPQHTNSVVATDQSPQTEPTIIEGYLNGQRVMGLDFDQDGIIDTMVIDGQDGQTYRVVDATGDEGLDTIYRYDSFNNELTAAVRLDHPVVVSNDDFSQHLESTMPKEAVDSILNEHDPSTSTGDNVGDQTEGDSNIHLANSPEPDDTYTNNGDVREMDE